MSSCFKSPYLGIRGGCRIPTSGEYINDLTGIEIKTLVGVAKDEILRGEDMLSIIEQESVKKVKSDIEAKIFQDNTFKSILSHDRLVVSPQNLVSIEDKNFGIRFVKNTVDKFKTGVLNFITIFSEETFKAVLRISKDGIEEEREIVLEGKKLNKIDLNLKLDADEVIVYLYTCGYRVGIYVSDNCICKCRCKDEMCYDVYPVESDGLWFSNISEFRIGYDMTCCCDIDVLHCILAKDYIKAIKLYSGILILREVISGSNANPLIYNKQDQAKYILSRWEGTNDPLTGFDNKSEYAILINNIVERAKSYISGINSECIICNGIKLIPLI